jgi:protein-S-isoprenylcysteine O-methyltransferase Ste14
MQKIKDFFKRIWAKLKSINWMLVWDSREFTYFFPLTVMILSCIILKSIILMIAVGLFTVNIFRTYPEK